MEHLRDFLTIDIDKERRIIISNWLRHVNSEEFREGMLFMEECIAQRKLVSWLANMLRFTPPGVLDQRWTVDSIITLLEKTPLKKVALVLPGDYILHMIGEKMKKEIYKRFGHKIRFECFSRQEHAQHWLDSAEETEAIQ